MTTGRINQVNVLLALTHPLTEYDVPVGH